MAEVRLTFGAFFHNGIPAPLAFLAMAAEFFGSIGLLAGLFTRVAGPHPEHGTAKPLTALQPTSPAHLPYSIVAVH